MDLIKSKNIQGFSLVEISIVCAVLAILMLPVFAIMSSGSKATIRNRNEILAQQYAMNIISYCNITAYDDVFLKPTAEKEVDEATIKLANNNKVFDIGILEEGFAKIASRTISVTEFEPDNVWPKKYKIIKVTVSWKQPGDTKKHEVTVSGLVSSI